MIVKDILNFDCSLEIHILAGKDGIENEVKTVTIMDIPDITNWLRGGELLISGVLFSQCCSKKFIDELVAKRIPGIITKEKFTNQIEKEIFEYCDFIHFPIIIVPPDCNWGEIMNPIISYIVKEPLKIIEESHKFHDALMKSMIEGSSLSTLCSQLYISANLSLAIADNDYHLLGYSDNLDWIDLTRKLSKYTIQYSGYSYASLDEKKSYVYTYQTLSLSSFCLKILIYPVTLNHNHYGNILLAVNEKMKILSPMDTMKIQQLGIIVALNATKQNEINTATRQFNNLVLDRLLQENTFSITDAEAILSSIKKKMHRYYYMVQFKYDDTYNFDIILSQRNKINRLHAKIESNIANHEHILLFERSGTHIVLIPDSTQGFEQLLLKLKNFFIETLDIPNIFIGISEITPINKLSKAFIQSEYTANYALTYKIDKPFLYYSQLGILKYFMESNGHLNETFLRELYKKYIVPLIEHDTLYHSELLKTLEIYFKNNCSKTKTEAELFIHKNTLRARIASINKLLDCNIDSMEIAINIEVALKFNYYCNH